MKKIVFATHNNHKLEEVKALLSEFQVVGLDEIGCVEEIPETSDTLEGNALQKARFVYDNYQLDCFADDTGLEVDHLDGAPGIYSARYAGEEKSAKANMQKLLKELEGIKNRKARFRTVIALLEEGKETFHEGIVLGQITEEESGQDGFGYDPVFLPHEKTVTFAQLDMDEKNAISHRGRAIRKLIEYLSDK